MNHLVFQHLQHHIESVMKLGENCSRQINEATEMLTQALLSGHSIYSCGIGETELLSKLFVHYLSNSFQIERPGFPAIDLGGIVSLEKNDDSFSNALHIHSKREDILVVFTLGYNEESFIKTIETAMDKGLFVLLISANNDNILASKLGSQDIEINCNLDNQSLDANHFLIIQCLCTLIENKIFGGN